MASDTLAFPLTLYYDASCPLCLAEMTAIPRHDAHGRIHLVDCSVPGFSDPQCDAAGIATPALMWRLHARDAEGRWRIGVPAFAAAYGAIGVDGLAAFFGSPRLERPLRWLYGLVADNRQRLSRLGLNGLFGMWVGWMARRAQARAAACHDGVCVRPDR
jgi:predicted DCC family thiol-disulfide oxidoreductase YuxK